ncbi:DNA polymerase III subunit delta' [Corynebacterium poyangense]|uniref:DNA polymerase III subunit delta n=1 Tax=Corynebacterium poyangense TaxID=2684405 RepID=A0A7H0SS35_9CORY|nr:DNA polymerase III subunit delta' [Corynebacterium poyangense]QNQ91360.1 DNA polymerase III subunit delta' [Corynebacterium poyangense]
MADRLSDTPAVQRIILEAAQAARQTGTSTSAMTHAWVFTGPPGSGRSVAALCLAAALVCEASDLEHLGTSEAAHKVFHDSHTDVVHVVPEELSIGVDRVRGIIRDAAKMPTVAPWRVLIMEDADRLTESAANTLLKTVEEPPERTVIILCAPSIDPEDFSVTLRSRCRHVYVPTPSRAEITRILVEEEGASHADAELAAAASARHIGRARRLVRSPEAQQRRAQILGLAELINHGDQAFRTVTAIVKAVQKETEESYAQANAEEIQKLKDALGMGAKGKGAHKALRGATGQIRDLEKQHKKQHTRRVRDVLDLALFDLAGLYRDALMLKTGANVELTHPDFEGLAREIAEGTDASRIVACVDAVRTCREQLGQNVTPAVAMDAMVGRIRIASGVR